MSCDWSSDVCSSDLPGHTIPGLNTPTIFDKAANLIPQVESSMVKIDSIMTALNTLLNDPALKHILDNTKEITENLNKSTAQLNVLMTTDIPKMTKTFYVVGTNLESVTAKLDQLDLQATFARIDKTIDNVYQLTDKLNSKDNTVGLLLNDPSLYNNLNKTVNSANALLENIKEQPKRYVHFSVFGKKN